MFLLTEQISKDELKKYIKELYNYACEHLRKIDRKPKIFLKEDLENADDIFGKTGFYDPHSEQIFLYTAERHPKDVLRSLAHELVHHEQNCRGDTERLDLSKTASDPAYASHDEGLREMEREAFERGNMIFRDWCDGKKLERTKEKDKIVMSESKKVVVKDTKEETKKEDSMPYEQLFQKKDRLLKDRMNQHETEVYEELLKRFTQG